MPSLFTKTGSDKTDNIIRRHTREPLFASARKSPGLTTMSASALFSSAAARVRLGFVGMAAGAGATTLSFAAAEYLAGLSAKRGGGAESGPRQTGRGRAITMLELDLGTDASAGMPYDKIGIDRRFAGRDFISFYRLAAENKPLHGVRNIDGGVGWALRVPGDPEPAPDPTTLHRLISNIAGDILICDISAQGILNGTKPRMNREALIALLADLDHIVLVFDPLPSRLLASVPAAEACRAAAAAGVPSTYVFNKLNEGVNLREALRFTGIKDFLPFPAIPAEAVYRAEYACRSLAPELSAPLAALFPE